MRKLKHLLAIAVMVAAAAMFMPSSSALAQNHTGSCDDDDPNCPGVPWVAWGGFNPHQIVVAPGCTLRIDIFTRLCHGLRQFRYGSYTTVLSASGHSNCYLYSTGTLTLLIDLWMLQHDVAGGATSQIPRCETGNIARRYQFWSASCYALQHCRYTYACDANIDCDIDPNNPPFPPGTNSWDVYTWLPCGTTCCQRIYELCLDEDGVTVQITSVSTTADRCDNPPGYPNCQPACDW